MSEAKDLPDEQDPRYGCPNCLSVFRLGYSLCPIDGGVLQRVDEDPLIGETLADRYVIEECVGEGGMGRVYRARHQRVSRQFAIKILFGELATDSKMRQRFSREAEAASRLSHPNVISVTDFGETPRGLLYLAMDFVEGPELADVIREEGAMPPERIISITAQLCQGLAHAHEEGLVHRDFKGQNVILARRGNKDIPRIVDFGIAVMLEEPNAKLTTEGLIIGTPAYMSPEQACGLALDARSDLFSLGVLMYEMLAGVPPFEGDPMMLARQNFAAPTPPIRERVPGLEVDPGLEDIMRKLMHKKPEDRFQSASEVLEALEAHPSDSAKRAPKVATFIVESSEEVAEPVPGRRTRLVALASVALLAMVGVGVFLLGNSSKDDRPLAALAAAIDAAAVPDDLMVPISAELPPDAALAVAQSADADAADLSASSSGPVGKPKTKTGSPSALRPGKTNTADPGAATKPVVEVVAEPVKEPGDTPPTLQALTQLYVSVGESIQDLRRTQPEKVDKFQSQYSSLPFNDALRIPALRKDVANKLRRLATAIKKETDS